MDFFERVREHTENLGVLLVTFLISLCLFVLLAKAVLWLISGMGVDISLAVPVVRGLAMLGAVVLTAQSYKFYKKGRKRRAL